ncbi:hypothetical protein, partial [Escherichia coli]|uniref:hypothetical protein n=1 Tax=Escherichia coli TaxID=562 RepID=UPI001BAEAF2C
KKKKNIMKEVGIWVMLGGVTGQEDKCGGGWGPRMEGRKGSGGGKVSGVKAEGGKTVGGRAGIGEELKTVLK